MKARVPSSRPEFSRPCPGSSPMPSAPRLLHSCMGSFSSPMTPKGARWSPMRRDGGCLAVGTHLPCRGTAERKGPSAAKHPGVVESPANPKHRRPLTNQNKERRNWRHTDPPAGGPEPH